MKKTINILLIIVSLVLFQNCEDDQFETSLSYVTFGDSTYSTGVDVGGSTTIDVTVFSNKNVASDVTFNVVVDESSTAAAGSYNVPSSVTIPSGSNKGTLTIGLSDVNLGIGVNKLVLKFDDVDAAFASGNSTTVEYIQNCTEVTGTFDIRFNYPCEVSWDIKDSLGGVVLSGSGYPGCSGAYSTLSIPITLCAGRSYTLTTTDDYGDGWGGTGSYTLTIGGVVKVSGDGSLMDNGGLNEPISSTVPFTTN
ncbi:hypothetical protein [Litoribaculum gwangyangense]|uniref:Calx-beta domain-containing protein n=1 Tax=Litoribaculum gwangyangense TaxID=1130722 RepID=A0ABP9CA72_9FLAO